MKRGHLLHGDDAELPPRREPHLPRYEELGRACVYFERDEIVAAAREVRPPRGVTEFAPWDLQKLARSGQRMNFYGEALEPDPAWDAPEDDDAHAPAPEDREDEPEPPAPEPPLPRYTATMPPPSLGPPPDFRAQDLARWRGTPEPEHEHARVHR